MTETLAAIPVTAGIVANLLEQPWPGDEELSMSELFMVVSLHAKDGKEEELRRDLVEVVEPSRREDGNIRYDLFVDRSDPGRFIFFEHWTSSEQQEKHHNQGPHIQHFQANGAKNVERTEFVVFLDQVV